MALLSLRRSPALAVGVLALGLLAATRGSASAVRVDQPAPAFTLRDGATTTTLDDHRGQVIVLDFWATWCTLCIDALPKLDALARAHVGKGLVVLAVNIDADPETASGFLDEHVPKATFRVLYDPRGRVMARYGAKGMPALFVIDRRGRVRYVMSGDTAAAHGDLEAVVERLLTVEGSATTSGGPD